MSNNETLPQKITARDKYLKIVDNFIKKLENNDIEPWTKSWSSNTPKNFESNNQYNGMNILTLLDRGFSDSRFLTFQQIKKLGGSVKKGEISTPIFFMKPVEKISLNEETNEEQKESYFLMQSYNVFNIEQTTGIAYEKEKVLENKHTSIQNWIDEFNIETYRGEPAYSPNNDCIFMMHSHEFLNEEEYYGTYFHELTHYTGHKTRLDRFEKHTVYGDEKYAFEELIAELGSAFLAREHNIKPNSKKQASYLKSWIMALSERPNILYTASSHASKAVNYLIDTNKIKKDLKVKEDISFNIDLSIEPVKSQIKSNNNTPKMQ